MPLPKNINTYADVAAILEPSREEGGAEYTLGSRKEAIRWRQRAYYYRTLLYQRDGFTPYDNMTLTLLGLGNVVEINFDITKGILRSLKGKKIEPGEYTIPADSEAADELTLAAEKLSKELENK